MEVVGSPRRKGREKAFNLLEENIAVMLVDMQEDFVKHLRRGEADRIIPNQLAILKRCRELSIPVVVLELRVKEFGKTIKILMDEISKNPSKWVIEKDFDDGFYLTNLDSSLKYLNIKKIFIMGINADFCVRDTARTAIKLGYKIVTSGHVIAGQPDHSKNNSIIWFANNGSCVSNIARFVVK